MLHVDAPNIGPATVWSVPADAAVVVLRAGAGLCVVAAPAPILPHVITLEPGATGVALATDADRLLIADQAVQRLDALRERSACLVVGPGLGSGDGVAALTMRAVCEEPTPVVLDADGLNALAELPEYGRDMRAPAVLTPHPGEFRRLTRGLGLRDDLGLDASRRDAATALAQRLGVVVVLKGARTVVTDGASVYEDDSEDPVLSTGGTGDVLAGLIGGLVAQFVPEPSPLARLTPPNPRDLSLFQAACLAVRVHAAAAATWRAGNHAATGGMLARELAALIPAAVESMRGG